MPPALPTRQALIGLIGALLVGVPVARLAALVLLGTPSIADLDGDASPALVLSTVLLFPPIAGIAWLWFFTVWSEPGGWERLGLAPAARNVLVRGLAVGLFAVGIGAFVTTVSSEFLGRPSGPPVPLRLPDGQPQGAYLFVLFIGAAIAAPIFEEMLFRGVVFGWLRQHLPFALSATIAALMHGFVHGDVAAVPTYTAIFLLFAWIYQRERTLVAPIVAHGVHNAIVLLISGAPTP